MKRFSVAVGSFVVLIIVSIPLGFDAFIISVYAGFVETSAMIIMSLFGKNGNGNLVENNSGNSTNHIR